MVLNEFLDNFFPLHHTVSKMILHTPCSRVVSLTVTPLSLSLSDLIYSPVTVISVTWPYLRRMQGVLGDVV